MTVPDDWLVPVVSVLVNGAVTWGVLSTKLQWLRADVARLETDVHELRRMWTEFSHGKTQNASA